MTPAPRSAQGARLWVCAAALWGCAKPATVPELLDAIRTPPAAATVESVQARARLVFTPDLIAQAEFERLRWIERVRLPLFGPPEIVDTRVRGDRAAFTLRGGEDSTYLLARRTGDGWRLDDAAIEPGHVDAWLAGATFRPPRDPELADVGRTISRALDAHDRAALLAITRPEAIDGDRHREAGLFSQYIRKGLGLAVHGARSTEGRGVIYGDAMRGDRAVDRVQLLTRRDERGWVVEAITENRHHTRGWLMGALPARLALTALPVDPEATAVGEAVRAALVSRDVEACMALLAPSEDPPSRAPRGDGLRRWLTETLPTLTDVGPASVRVWAPTGRGIAELALTHARGSEPPETTVVLYFKRVDGGWRWTGTDPYPDRGWVFGVPPRYR